MAKTTQLVVQDGVASQAGNSNHRPGGDLLSELAPEQKLALYKEHGVNPDAPLEQLQADAMRDFGHAQFLALRAGVALQAIKDRCAHGEFEQRCAAMNLHQQRASEMMMLASRYAVLPADARKQLLSGSKSNALALASLDAETLEAAAEMGDLARLAALPKAQLLQLIRRQRTQNIQTEERAKQAEHDRDLARRKPLQPKLMLETLTVRGETAALTQHMDLCTDSLDRLFHELLVSPVRFGVGNQDQRDLAAGTFVHRIKGVAARVDQLLRQAHEVFGDEVCGKFDPTYNLSAEEMAELLERFRRMALTHVGEAEARRIQREDFADGPMTRKPGRPRGSMTAPHKGRSRRG